MVIGGDLTLVHTYFMLPVDNVTMTCFRSGNIFVVAADEQLMWLSTMFALLGKTGISGGWAAALVSSAEVFPTVVR